MDHYFKILMIDDDQDDHDLFRATIKEVKVDGVKISQFIKMKSVYDGREALNYISRKGEYEMNKDEVPDFIVLDLNMPILDGFTFLEEMKKIDQCKDVPVYILTTTTSSEHKKICLTYRNCAGFYSKPSTRREILPIVEQMLNVFSA